MVLWILPRLLCIRLRGFHPLRPAFPGPFPFHCRIACAVRTPGCTHPGLGSSGSARRYSRNRCFFLFLRLLRCFSSPGSPPCVMCWRMDTWGLPPCGFPHSDTCGSPGMCPSPQLFAACRVFRRLPVPRHPPRALSAWPVPPSGSPERDALSFAKKLSRKIYKYDAELKNYWYLT